MTAPTSPITSLDELAGYIAAAYPSQVFTQVAWHELPNHLDEARLMALAERLLDAADVTVAVRPFDEHYERSWEVTVGPAAYPTFPDWAELDGAARLALVEEAGEPATFWHLNLSVIAPAWSGHWSTWAEEEGTLTPAEPTAPSSDAWAARAAAVREALAGLGLRELAPALLDEPVEWIIDHGTMEGFEGFEPGVPPTVYSVLVSAA